MSPAKRTEREAVVLASSVFAAARGMRSWELPQSVLGRFRFALPPRSSEYSMFASPNIRRSGRFLVNVLIPSRHRHGPSWLPGPIRRVFFHETTIQRRPDQDGSLDSFPAEQWFFINGILTDPGMAAWNADYLVRMFHRPLTIIQNATDGPVADLLECADEKAFGMNGEAADVAFPEVHRALKDPSKERVVIIAHSQGTLIAAVILKLLKLIYERAGELISDAKRADELAALRRTGVSLDPSDFRGVSTAELRRLEVYCFANCASEMRYVDPDAELPWIESLGNEHDLVARLGMLAPDLLAEGIAIDGPLWIRRGGWGHLLNHHYLWEIDRAHRAGLNSGSALTSAEPFEQIGGPTAKAPRLYAYFNGGRPASTAR